MMFLYALMFLAAGGASPVIQNHPYPNATCLGTGGGQVSGALCLDTDVELRFGNCMTGNVKLFDDGTDFRLQCPTCTNGFRFDAPVIVGRFEMDANSGSMRWINQNMTSALSDGTEVCAWAGLDNTNVFAFCAEADGNDGVDVKGYNHAGLDGALETCRWYPYTLDFGAGAGTATWSSALPVGSYNIAITGRVIEADTGPCTSLDIGDGTDADRWAAGLDETSVGEVFGSADHTADGYVNVDTADTAQDIVATCNGGNGVDLRVYLMVKYCISSGPTSSASAP